MSLFAKWCESEDVDVDGQTLHVFRERDGVRESLDKEIEQTVISHYEDPLRLSERIGRIGLPKAAAVLREMLPRTKKARSGHLGEIFATEVVPSVLRSFEIPIKRLRWLDGREAALRGEDLIGIERAGGRVRFLKGESKSRANLSAGVVAEAREMLAANDGRPSQHALVYIMHRLFELQQDDLAIVFEKFILLNTIPAQQVVHLVFALSGNNPSDALINDLKTCGATYIEQHAVTLRIADHQKFIASVYDRLTTYGT